MPLVDQDQEQLKLLVVFHYVYAGMTAFVACLHVILVAIGTFLLTHPDVFAGGKGPPPPSFMGMLLVIMGVAFLLWGWVHAICIYLAGRFLAQRKHRVFCLIIAGVDCTMIPLGTALGVFTLVLMTQPSVKALFSESQPQALV